MIEVFEIFILFVLFSWMLFASISDIKKREVPDWLNFSLIAIGLGSRLIYSLNVWDYHYFVYGIFGGILMFIIAFIMSYTKQWGDGDSKLLIGVGVCLGFNFAFSFFDISSWPILMYFFINSLIVGAFYGLFYSIGLMILHFKDFSKELFKFDKKIFFMPLVVFLVLSAFSLFFTGILRWLFIIAVLGLVLGIYVLILIKVVEKSCMFKIVKTSDLVPGDWVVNSVKIKGKTIYDKKNKCLEEEHIKLFKKYHIKQVLVKQGIPFVPSFFIGLIISVIWGNLLLYLF